MYLTGDALITALRPPCPTTSENSKQKEMFWLWHSADSNACSFLLENLFQFDILYVVVSFHHVINPSWAGKHFQTLLPLSHSAVSL